MAKLDARRIQGFLADPGATRVVLLFGEDTGLVRERGDMLTRAVAGDDPFRLVELPRDVAAKDVTLLPAAPATPALTGGRRLVRVGKVSMAPECWLYTSARRYRAMGKRHVVRLYVRNFWSELVHHRPRDRQHVDVRI